MNAGLQVYNPNGQIRLDTSTDVWKEVGTFTCQFGDSGLFHSDALKNKRIAIFLKSIQQLSGGVCYEHAFPIYFSFDNAGGNIRWSWNRDYRNGSWGVNASYVTYKLTYVYGWY